MRCFHRLPMNRGCAHRHLGSAPYPTPAETRWTGTPATVRLSVLDTGALTAHVVDRHMQPSRRFPRKADDLPWSVLAHASSVVTRGRLQSGSHGLRWRARDGSFGIPGPCWPGAVLSIADPAGRRSHLRVYGRPARAALTAGGSLTPANAPQWPQEPLSRDTEGEKVLVFVPPAGFASRCGLSEVPSPPGPGQFAIQALPRYSRPIDLAWSYTGRRQTHN